MAGNLEYVIIKGAGQFVPYDQPASALQMVDDFVKRHPWFEQGTDVELFFVV